MYARGHEGMWTYVADVTVGREDLASRLRQAVHMPIAYSTKLAARGHVDRYACPHVNYRAIQARENRTVTEIILNRAPVLTLWAAVVAERLGQPHDTALTLGRAVAGSAARVKARNIGREERKADALAEVHVTAPVLLLGKTIRLLPNEDGELRAADGDQPADPADVQ